MASVLVVEDDRQIARSIVLRLQASGHAVRVAHDVPAAVEEIDVNPPGVAVLDIALPGGGGFAVADRLRQLEDDVDIVFLTAISHPDTRLEADRFHPRAFLEKPFTASDLVAAVASS